MTSRYQWAPLACRPWFLNTIPYSKAWGLLREMVDSRARSENIQNEPRTPSPRKKNYTKTNGVITKENTVRQYWIKLSILCEQAIPLLGICSPPPKTKKANKTQQYVHPKTSIRMSIAALFFFFFKFVVNFVIHWNETAMGLHVFPIPIPPATSLSTRSP